MCSPSPSLPESLGPGDEVPGPGSSGIVDPGLTELRLPGLGAGAHPPTNQRVQVVPRHSQPCDGMESPIIGDADCHRPSCRDGWAAHCAMGGSVFYRAIRATGSHFENFGTWICDLILGPPLGQVRLADWLEEAVGRLRVEHAKHQEADTKLEGLWNSATQVWDLVLGGPTGDVLLGSVVVFGRGADHGPRRRRGS
jgi:hypothetical protein